MSFLDEILNSRREDNNLFDRMEQNKIGGMVSRLQEKDGEGIIMVIEVEHLKEDNMAKAEGAFQVRNMDTGQLARALNEVISGRIPFEDYLKEVIKGKIANQEKLTDVEEKVAMIFARQELKDLNDDEKKEMVDKLMDDAPEELRDIAKHIIDNGGCGHCDSCKESGITPIPIPNKEEKFKSKSQERRVKIQRENGKKKTTKKTKAVKKTVATRKKRK